jgi:uncharacterized Zn finger protein
MPKKNSLLKKFSVLTWNNLEEWAGSRIADRGRRYQQQGRVTDLAVTDDSALLGWVQGSEKYATKVIMDKGGLPESNCSCPYGIDCKHGVAVVIEYLKQLERDHPVSKAKEGDNRLKLLADEYLNDDLDDDETTNPEIDLEEIDNFLKRKTKAQLIELIHELAVQHPEMARELSDRIQLNTGNVKKMTTHLRREIKEIGYEPGWQNYWKNEGYTPEYSGVRKKLKKLLNAGHTEAVLILGRELVTIGCRQVEESHDEGETAMEVAACMPIIVDALDQSNLNSAEKLNWALDAELEDQYDICEAFAEYLHRQHPKSGWNSLADRLLARLKKDKGTKIADDINRKFNRNRLSNWAIHALENAGREKEIIPLCIAEAELTGSYDRLVSRLIKDRRYEDAERWIHKGIRATKEQWPGIASGLRDTLLEIRIIEKNWPAVTAMQVENFVRRPSRQTFSNCKKASGKIKSWSTVRGFLLQYLEKSELPWKQKKWSLPESGLDRPHAEQRKRFPLINHLIDIAILEKKPDQVLRWYDQLSKDRFGWYGIGKDAIATSIQTHAPDRAVDIWKNMAERLIDQVKPRAYKEASKYLRKASKVMNNAKKQAEWKKYIQKLREIHARKRRLLEILDNLEDKPIIA